MRRYAITIALAAAVLAAIPSRASAQASLGSPFELRVGQSLQIGDLLLGFDAVSSDGRCPIGLLCIWEGNAVCEMWADSPEAERAEFRLNTSAMFQREATYDGFRILLLILDPYPVFNSPPDTASYVATILVTRDKSTTPTEPTTWGRIKSLYSR